MLESTRSVLRWEEARLCGYGKSKIPLMETRQMCRYHCRLAIGICVLMLALGFNVSVFGQEQRIDEEPKQLIAVTLWFVTVTDPSSNHVARATNIPPVMGSIEEARKLIRSILSESAVGKMREVRILCVDGAKAEARVGANMPRVVATNRSEGRRVNALQIEPIGTLVRIQPRIDSDNNIQLGFFHSISDMKESADVIIETGDVDDTTYATVVDTQSLETTTTIRSGRAVLVHCEAPFGLEEGVADNDLRLIIVSADIVEAEAKTSD